MTVRLVACGHMDTHTHTHTHTHTYTGHNKIQLYAIYRNTLYIKSQIGPFLCTVQNPVQWLADYDLWSPCLRTTWECGIVKDAGLASRFTEREELIWWEGWQEARAAPIKKKAPQLSLPREQAWGPPSTSSLELACTGLMVQVCPKQRGHIPSNLLPQINLSFLM